MNRRSTHRASCSRTPGSEAVTGRLKVTPERPSTRTQREPAHSYFRIGHDPPGTQVNERIGLLAAIDVRIAKESDSSLQIRSLVIGAKRVLSLGAYQRVPRSLCFRGRQIGRAHV